MRKLFNRLTQFIIKEFKNFWILSSIVLLIIGLIYNQQVSVKRSNELIQDVAVNISNNVDGLIEDLFQEVYTLPIYGNKIPSCKSGLFTNLEHVTANNTKISGLIISDKNHELICSTLPENETLIAKTMHARTIEGPFKLSLFDQPVYLIQQKMGNYYIGIIIFSSLLENALKPSKKIISSVALHDQFDNKNLVRIEPQDNLNGWRFSKDLQRLSPASTESMFAIDPLQTIDGVAVVVFENPTIVQARLWFSQGILLLLFLLCSYLLYSLAKSMLTKRYSLHGALKAALKNKEFFPVYQPLFDVELGAFSGVEVLLRWQDNQDEIIMPDFFIEEAETTGLIVPITLQIIEIAFQECKDIFRKYPNFHLGFNLSADHFTDPTFFKAYEILVKRYTIAPHQVLFEITERDLMDKNDAIFSDKMTELRTAGYSLAVDDYGTGHASISYLQHFPFNYLKIDKLFVQAIGTKAITESLNDAIIQMGKSLNLYIIAEGVETAEQVQYLTENGVRFLQGWYFSKALSVAKLRVLLKEKNNVTL